MDERELVPYEPTQLRGERLLVLAPHPDDEVIACGGLIAQHAAEGRAIRVIVATDGRAAAGPTDDAETYVRLRMSETDEGLRLLGARPATFLAFADRSLLEREEPLAAAVAAAIVEFRPDLIAAPSPLEVHPDHAALARAVVRALQDLERDRGIIALTRVAFYEVSQPIRPNTLVDISAELERKRAAIEQHRSQLAVRSYSDFAVGLNRYRSMTLSGVDAAEGYWVTDAAHVATAGWNDLATSMSPATRPTIIREDVSVTTIIRTRNRVPLLKEAIASAAANTVRPRIVVVNDGGASVRDALAGDPVELIELPASVGRSEAMNRGVAAAETDFVSFLDDDDLYEPDHIELLTAAAGREEHRAYYTDAVSVFYRREEGEFREVKRLRLFAQDDDPDLLILDNYIPLITLMVRKRDYLDSGGFSPAFDLFEDWDFLLRLRQRGSFLRVPRVSCRIRHFEGGDSITLAATSDREKLSKAKSQIWSTHGGLMTHERLARAVESQKRRMEQAERRAVEHGGRAQHLELDVTRLTREKSLLLAQIAGVQETLASREEQLRAVAEDARQNREQLEAHREALGRATAHLEESSSALQSLREDQQQKEELLARLYAEIARLNGLLDTIYASRSWKLHTFVERLSGRR